MSARVAEGLPNAMFSAMVPVNSQRSWVTIAAWPRTYDRGAVLIGSPSTRIDPEDGS